MVVVRYLQSTLDWQAAESLVLLFGATAMLLTISPLVDATARMFMTCVVVALMVVAISRVRAGSDWSLFKSGLPRATGQMLRWGAACALLAAALKVIHLERIQPEGLFLEMLEAVSYLVVMSVIMFNSLHPTFMVRQSDTAPANKLVVHEKRMNYMYLLVVVRIMLHQTAITDLSYIPFFAFALFQNGYIWTIGFQSAKFK